ncbi:eosinophil peroxidase-like [Scyliorhinus canicula]|uniref:eosinophil peroxidase-like n=1 Tax=Scyliorhinus canicula TaxID=7830 RepID=UPI0018F41E9E|nr:eosinophil peroxidase-like [Scyliorhinus canicula]
MEVQSALSGGYRRKGLEMSKGVRLSFLVLSRGIPQLLLLLSYLSSTSTSAKKSHNIQGCRRQQMNEFVNETVKEAFDHAFCSVKSVVRYKERRSGNMTAEELLQFFKLPVAATLTAVKSAELMENTIEILRQMAYTNVTDLVSRQDLKALAKATGCATQMRPVTCSNSCLLNKYRNITGICNNRQKPWLGASNTPFARWIDAEYEDGFSMPRGWNESKEYNGFPLPPVRKVTTEILHTRNENISLDSMYAHILVEWGQWIDHDIDMTPQSASSSSFNDSSDCSLSCHNRGPCFPIKIPDDDPRAGKGKMCMPFFRSAPTCGISTETLQPRQQMNSITSFVDASMIYGSTDSLARKLRNLTNDLGYLAINQEYSDDGLAYLPFMRKKLQNPCALTRNQSLTANTSDIPCFLAGDSRANEHLGLQVLHIIFLREHNRLASRLHQLNPHWGGETLYQEARKILGAYQQIINWKDYIPKVLGPDATMQHMPHYKGYNETIDPQISNVFATAAFRFGHVTIHPIVYRLDENYRENPAYPNLILHKSFFSPWRIIEEGGADPLIRGIILNPAKLQTQTQMMPDELTEKLFQPKASIALDLASLNLQRGRDHGLPSYNAWRQFCGLEEARNISELMQIFNNTDLVAKLMSVYKTPENIDVWIGAIAEPFLPGARVGELLACLLGKQFQVVRDGDRFWWENEGVFTDQQKETLGKATLSRIICDNTRIQKIPVDVFSHNQYPNDFVDCTSSAIPSLNLSAWKENITVIPCREVPKVERAYFFFCNRSIHFECHAGFKLVGTSSLTCDPLTGAWSSAAPTCQDNLLKDPKIIIIIVVVVCGSIFCIILAVVGFQRYGKTHQDGSKNAIKCGLCIKCFSSKNDANGGDSTGQATNVNSPSS